MKNHKAIDQENNGVYRRSFIEKTIFASAGIAALAASQNQTSAQTGKRNIASIRKCLSKTLPERSRT